MTMEQILCIGTTRKSSRKTLQLETKFRSARVHFFDADGDVSQAVQPRSPLYVRPVGGRSYTSLRHAKPDFREAQKGPTRRVEPDI